LWCVTLVFLAIGCQKDRIKKDAPNILLVTVDTLRADHLSLYSYPRDTSPNIDALGNKGAVFTQSRAQATVTLASHQSILTSQYPDDTGGLGNVFPFDPETPTLAKILHEQGYRTGAVVSNFNLRKAMGLATDFDYYDDDLSSQEQNRKVYEKPPKQVTVSAVQWLRENKNQRYFLWVHYQSPHGPYLPAPPFDRKFLREDYSNSEKVKISKQNYEKGTIPDYQKLGTRSEYDYYVDSYDGEISEMDHWIGVLIDEMNKMGLMENTLVVFTSDHGESLGEHDWYFSHGQHVYEDQAQVPLVIYYPEIVTGPVRIDAPVQGVDIMPTILDVCGLDYGNLRGISLLTFLKPGATSTRGSPLLTQSENGLHRAVYLDGWKFILTLSTPPREELYNLEKDPEEIRNLIQVETKQAAIMRELLGDYTKTRFEDLPKRNMPPVEQERLKALGYLN